MMSFSDFIRKTRRKAGVTQRSLSTATGYSVAFIGAWEQGKAYPPKESLAILSKLLKVNKETIIDEVVKCKESKIRERYLKE